MKMKTRIILMVVILCTAAVLVSCSDDSTTEPTNTAPEITALVCDPSTVVVGAVASIACTAADDDGDALTYAWTCTAGTIGGAGATVAWTAPATVGSCSITCSVGDGDATVNDSVDVGVFELVVPGTMVAVSGGTFDMGDSYDEGPAEERPVHAVAVGDFLIGKYEVTQAEWDVLMADGSYTVGAGANHPVYDVSWFQMIKYCNLKSMAEGLTPCYIISSSTDPVDWPAPPVYSDDSSFPTWDAVVWEQLRDGYRLPTEAEWEYAARGGVDAADDHRYSGGGVIGDVAWYVDNAPAACQAVGGKLPNQLGLYDMSGNVYEFCWDRFAADYYTTCDGQGTVVDPVGAPAGDMRVQKGGARADAAANCRVAGRFRDYPVSAASHTGFRLVRKP